jgi:hypothetical protein
MKSKTLIMRSMERAFSFKSPPTRITAGNPATPTKEKAFPRKREGINFTLREMLALNASIHKQRKIKALK